MFLLALAALLFALGAGFFGLATLSREGVSTPQPTPLPTSRPTAVPPPVAVPSDTPAPTATSTPEPSATPEPPSPTPVPPTPSPVPPTAAPAPLPSPTPRVIAVPQLRGKTLEQAQATLASAGLTVMVKGVNANVDKNVVVDQTPDVNSTLQPGGTVTISVGTGSTVVPQVTNLPRDQAVRLLQSNGFRVTLQTRRDQRIPAGAAIGTNPPGDTVVPRNSDVELDISAGR